MVPVPSIKVSRVSMYSGSRLVSSSFAYGAFTLSGWLSQNHSAKLAESIPRSEPQHARTLVWALPVSLAATPGIDVSFSSSGYLDVSVHRVTSCMAIYSPYGTYTLLYVGSPIRKSVDHRIFAPIHSLSQLVTSFFGSCCQGIRLMLLLA